MIVLGVLILVGVVVNVAVTLVVCAHLNRNGKQYPAPAPGWMTETRPSEGLTGTMNVVWGESDAAGKAAREADAAAKLIERDPMIGLS